MHQRWMHQIGANGARASSERDEGDAQSMMVDNISVSAASSAKGPTSSVQAVTKQEVVQTMSSASSAVDDHLRLMTAGAAELRQMEVVRYHRGLRMPRTESRKFQHGVLFGRSQNACLHSGLTCLRPCVDYRSFFSGV